MKISTKEQLFQAVFELVNQGMVSDLAECGEYPKAVDVAECGIDTVFAQNEVELEPTDKLLKELTKKLRYYI